ncbi:hypothetical protein KCU85_g36, partial [Aureobasidium melanogenum]
MPTFRISLATSGSFSCILSQASSVSSQASQSISAMTVLVRAVSEKKGSSPQVVLCAQDAGLQKIEAIRSKDTARNQKSSLRVVRPWNDCKIRGSGCLKCFQRLLSPFVPWLDASVVVAAWCRKFRRGEPTFISIEAGVWMARFEGMSMFSADASFCWFIASIRCLSDRMTSISFSQASSAPLRSSKTFGGGMVESSTGSSKRPTIWRLLPISPSRLTPARASITSRRFQDKIADWFCGESLCFYQSSDLLLNLDDTAKEEITTQFDNADLRTNPMEVLTLTGTSETNTNSNTDDEVIGTHDQRDDDNGSILQTVQSSVGSPNSFLCKVNAKHINQGSDNHDRHITDDDGAGNEETESSKSQHVTSKTAVATSLDEEKSVRNAVHDQFSVDADIVFLHNDSQVGYVDGNVQNTEEGKGELSRHGHPDCLPVHKMELVVAVEVVKWQTSFRSIKHPAFTAQCVHAEVGYCSNHDVEDGGDGNVICRNKPWKRGGSQSTIVSAWKSLWRTAEVNSRLPSNLAETSIPVTNKKMPTPPIQPHQDQGRRNRASGLPVPMRDMIITHAGEDFLTERKKNNSIRQGIQKIEKDTQKDRGHDQRRFDNNRLEDLLHVPLFGMRRNAPLALNVLLIFIAILSAVQSLAGLAVSLLPRHTGVYGGPSRLGTKKRVRPSVRAHPTKNTEEVLDLLGVLYEDERAEAELVIGKGQTLLMRRGIRRRAATLEKSRHGATDRRQVLHVLFGGFGRSFQGIGPAYLRKDVG